jgi:hypothetical protein
MGDYMAHNLYMDRNYLPMANTRNLNTNPNGRNINELRYEPSQDNMSSEDISRVLDRNMNRMFEISRMGQKSMNV